MGEPEAAQYILPKKLDNLLHGIFGELDCFNLLGEIVSDYQQKLQLRLRSREWSNYIQPPLYEGPTTTQGVEVRARPV